MEPLNQRITAAGLATLVKVGFVGLFAAEAWRLGRMVAVPLNEYVNAGNLETSSLIVAALVVAFGAAYAYAREGKKQILQLIRSARIDLLVAFVAGGAVSVSFGGIGAHWYSVGLSHLSLLQLALLVAVPLVFGLLLVIRAVQAQYQNRAENASFFISDIEKQNKSEDLLGFTDNAERFAERVFNGGSSDSIVFGIDAPWGIGKSSFVNFCQEYWNAKYQDRVILYKFNPLRYEDRSNLLEKFVDGLVHAIQKQTFVPEIRPLISRYSRFIQGKGTIKIPGLDLEIMPGSYTVDDAFEDLETALKNLDKKILIVVDDLDRLSFSAIKDVLFAIKKSFTLPNISYVLCYDTDNIAALEKGNVDPDKITEFLEKFVNVKVSLYLDSETLAQYVSDNLAKSLTGNSQADPVLVSKAMGGLVDILKSADYHRYLPFVGDVRKLKRLLNTLLLLEVEKTDFENSDFDKKDLIHLLLVYINYPSIFRKIYNTETRGKRGFFSLVIPYDDYYPKDEEQPTGRRHGDNLYKNSTLYREYLKGLDENQAFLLNQIFSTGIRLEGKADIDSVPEEIKRTYACFNGAWNLGRNLEAYLNLIIRLSKPQKRDQYRFYAGLKDRVQQGATMDDVLTDANFAYSESEVSHEHLWRVLVNSVHDFSPAVGAHLITYLVDHVPQYSFFSNKELGLGLRDDLEYFLIKLLDTVGWSDANGKHRNNTPEYITEIAEWVFGEGRHAGHGVLQALMQQDRGVLGLYDTLAFRLFCSADRGGDIFNLQRALSLRANPAARSEGIVHDIVKEEMRQISQHVFSVFKEQYITPGHNLFALINALTLNELAGEWSGFVEAQIAAGKITRAEVDTAISGFKSRMKSFITYQLGNTMISHGVGCGFYDETGSADGQGIAAVMNDYLFGHCFNPTIDQNNYEHFLDYLLGNFASVFGLDPGLTYVPNVNEFTKVLDRTRLADYWSTNSTAIRALNLAAKEKVIPTGNYTASYAEDLEPTFVVLDKLVEEVATAAAAAVAGTQLALPGEADN